MHKTEIHRTAVVADGASIAPDVVIGPYAVIGENVTIGSGTKIGAHAIIDGITSIGQNCHIFAGASLGLEPQSFSYQGEPTGVQIGDRVVIREYATVHRATKEGTFTIVEDDCFLMNYVHIAHDCHLGKGVIMANASMLAGHVYVGDNTVMSGQCIFHQNVRIGRLCMVSGLTGSRQDLPPFVVLDCNPSTIRGVNTIGMRRQKIGQEARSAVKNAYRKLYRTGLNFSQAIEQIEKEGKPCSEVQEIIDFIRSSKRGVLKLYIEDESGESAQG
jgi:UDP-N-acetylglucosamine acyltransferase